MGELEAVETAISEIMHCAREQGLDFYPMRFEICPAEIIYTFGAYGMPTRYSHWSFGKAYHRIKTQYDYGLNRIYEMVINTRPCYAFLLSGNSLIQNKLVIAHVLAHSDFFKNNAYFSHTSGEMLETMAQAAARIREYEMLYGRGRVEEFLDAVLAIQEHVDPHRFVNRSQPGGHGQCRSRSGPKTGKEEPTSSEPEKDLLLFIMRNSLALKEWEKDIIGIVREETLYFWPQLTTKILNEGWATYWHVRLMRKLDLREEEALEFARMHAELIRAGGLYLNPYLVGLRILEDIERRWGPESLFEVRALENDVSFLRNFLTQELVEELDLYLYRRRGQEWRVVTKEWEQVREAAVANLVNGGYPYIVVLDGDYNRAGELYLQHVYEGVELDFHHMERALAQVYRLWMRPVHLETVHDGRRVVFCFNGERVVKGVKQ
ncbi:MAG: SpoVR family protein [Bacillota bacterium]